MIELISGKPLEYFVFFTEDLVFVEFVNPFRNSIYWNDWVGAIAMVDCLSHKFYFIWEYQGLYCLQKYYYVVNENLNGICNKRKC